MKSSGYQGDGWVNGRGDRRKGVGAVCCRRVMRGRQHGRIHAGESPGVHHAGGTGREVGEGPLTNKVSEGVDLLHQLYQ